MVGLGKRFVIVFSVLLVLNISLLVESCVAPITVPANPKSGPEIISVTVNNNPRQYPPRYTTDPYTGETYQTRAGYVEPRGNMTITLKNHPFTPCTDEKGNTLKVYYIVFFKGEGSNGVWTTRPYCVYQSDFDYTDIIFFYGDTWSMRPMEIGQYTNEGLVVFRIQTVIGYFVEAYEVTGLAEGLPYSYWVDAVFEGEGSVFTEFTVDVPSVYDKSGISKPRIQSMSVTPSSNPNAPPTIGSHNSTTPFWATYLPVIIITMCIIIIPTVIIMYFNKKRRITF